MKFVKGFMLLGLISLIAVSVHPSLSYAEQTQGTEPILVTSAEDTVIQTTEAGPFMPRIGARVIEGAYMCDRAGRWYYGAPYYRKSIPQFAAGGMDIAGYAPTNIGDIVYKGL